MKQLPLKKQATESFEKCLESLGSLLLSINKKEDFIPVFFTSSSQDCSQGCVFVALKGAKNDGHKYIKDAIAKGAKGIVYQNESYDKILEELSIFHARVYDSRIAYSLLQEAFYGKPAGKMNLIAVTGTNGKTTSAYLLKEFFSSKGTCGLISTVEYNMPGWSAEASRTTPSPELFQSLLFNMAEKACKYVIMELSSHGLDQNRTGSAKFAGAIFTNLSGDHLDYHGTMENYYLAKKKLFSDLLAQDGIAIINNDDFYGRRMISELNGKNVFSCGFSDDSVFRICDFRNRADGISFLLWSSEACFEIKSNLCGRYNAMNIAESFALAIKLNVEPAKMLQALQKNIYVPGRLEKIVLKNGALAFIDYAHTDDALEKVLTALSEIKKKRIIIVFGCGGDRDKTKRPRMGAVAAKFADIVIITSDNPRSEDPLAIINQIEKGIDNLKNCEFIVDRRKAIERAFEISESEDIILIAGKGHEKGQEINGKILPFDDKEEIKKIAE